MQVKLKPLSPSGLEDIVIDDCMFPVGRFQSPFRKYDKTVVAHLSRRHARIFSESGLIFIVDDGSSNGTTVNGKKLVDKPIRLQHRDVITFGEKLSYRAEIGAQSEQNTTELAAPAKLNVTLIPTGDELESLVIDRFPFLISKHGKFFGKYAKKFAKDIRYLSRRHAYFFVKGDDLYLEDLGSTNGTFVNGKRLDEHAALLHNGDTIEIGSAHFQYTIKLEKQTSEQEAGTGINAKAAQANSGAVRDQKHKVKTHADAVGADNDEKEFSDVTVGAKTTFISSSDSFLDIFCIQDEDDLPLEDEIPQEDDEPVKIKTARTGVGRFFQRTGAFFSQLRGAFADDTAKDNRMLQLIAGVVIVLALVAGGIYMLGAAKREIKELVAAEDYQQGLSLANTYLKANPQDEEIQQLAAEALVKFTVPPWIGALEQRDFEKARELITEMKQKSPSHKSAKELLYVLEWLTNLEEFIDFRGGIDAPIVIFTQEQRVGELLDWWEKDKKESRRLMGTILNHSSEFRDIHARTFSNLRALRNEKSIYLVAIDRLKSSLKEKLDSGRAEELGAVFDKFESKYPNIKGMDKVRKDWKSYLALKAAVEGKNLRETMKLVADNNLTIPPFKAKLDDLMANALPSEEFKDRYSQASTAWRSGKINDALKLLNTPGEAAWTDLVAPELERKQKIVNEYEKLRQYQGTDAYQSRLMAFYRMLDKNEDIYFINALEGTLKDYKKRLAGSAEQALEVARKDWIAYRQAGGIGGLLRLEESISSAYKQQAKRLSSAYTQAQAGTQAYEEANLDYSSEWKELFKKIKAEVRLQRRSLDDLSMVLDPSLLQSKLVLIPEP